MESPKIDNRSHEDLMGEIRSLIPLYAPEWKPSEDDSGIALAEIFTSMLGTVIHRLNQVPEKNFTAFLEMLGMKLLAPQPATAPVTFSLSKGTKEHVFVRAGTQMAAEDILFETEKSMFATPSMLIKVYGVDAEDDAIYESPTNIVAGSPALSFQTGLIHGSGVGDKEIFIDTNEGVNVGDLLVIRNEEYGVVSEVSDHLVKLLHKLEHSHASGTLVEKVTTFELFIGKDLQEHILYLGHTDLFNVKAAAKFTLTISPWDDRMADEGLVIWQYWGERLDGETKVPDWYDFDTAEGELTLTKTNTYEIKEREVSGIESRWIRCVVNRSMISGLQSVEIDTIKVAVEPPEAEDLFPDMIFYNDVPLEIPKDNTIHPFGTRPRGLDTFYIGSQEVFSKKGAEITIKFGIDETNVMDGETPVIKVQGVGKEFESRLKEAGIDTVGELIKLTDDELTEILSEGGTESRSYYSTRATNILEAARVGFYDKSDSSGSKNDGNNISSSTGNQELILSWEYWDGKGWAVIDGLKGFKGDPPTVYDFKFLEGGWVVFPYPKGIEAVKVSGQENYWIRVRIISGDYGREMEYVGEEWVLGKINPPKVSRITLSYELTTPANPEHCLTYNNLKFKDVSEESRKVKKPFAPFQPLDDRHKTLYMGFDKKLEKGPISIFFSFEEVESLEENTSKIEWYYYSQDKGWVGLEVSDNTQHFSRTGTVEFYIPADFARTSGFGNKLYWIRAVDSADKFRTGSPIAKGIYINTTLAIQAESVKDEILGSSNISADQKFQFARIPVITEEIWVNEITTLSEEGKKTIIGEDGEDSIIENKDSAGKTTEVWVRWNPVEDFFDSKPGSRYYVVERATGEVVFGGGVYGMIPPVGRDNIKATYQVGGGMSGNVGASEIVALKTSIPFVGGVTNHEAAEGGSDTEHINAVFERGSYQIRHRDRAVTEEDFERIARAASSYIARAKCYIEDGTLKIIVIPGGEEYKPIPSLTLRKTVEKHIKKRSLNLIPPERVEVVKPAYMEVIITAVVVPDSMDVAVPLEKEILERMKKFLHPLTGGPDGNGWEFGRGVHISDVYALLEGIKDVDHVEALNLNGGSVDVAVTESETVCSGEHKITMNPGSVS